jgi:hypothetical protein
MGNEEAGSEPRIDFISCILALERFLVIWLVIETEREREDQILVGFRVAGERGMLWLRTWRCRGVRAK